MKTDGGMSARPEALRLLEPGEVLADVGELCRVWVLKRGVLRLDVLEEGQLRLVQLALPGDSIGLERLIGRAHASSVAALTPCLVRSIDAATLLADHGALASAIVTQQRRAAQLAVLRCGRVDDRVRYLLALLARCELDASSDDLQHPLPTLREMAGIVDVAPETVSRALARLRARHLFQRRGQREAAFDPSRLRASTPVMARA